MDCLPGPVSGLLGAALLGLPEQQLGATAILPSAGKEGEGIRGAREAANLPAVAVPPLNPQPSTRDHAAGEVARQAGPNGQSAKPAAQGAPAAKPPSAPSAQPSNPNHQPVADAKPVVTNPLLPPAHDVYRIPLSAIEYIQNESSVKVGLHLARLDPEIYARMRDMVVRVNHNPHRCKAAGGRRVQSFARWVGNDPCWHEPSRPGYLTPQQAAHDVLIVESNGLVTGDTLEVAIVDAPMPFEAMFTHPHDMSGHAGMGASPAGTAGPGPTGATASAAPGAMGAMTGMNGDAHDQRPQSKTENPKSPVWGRTVENGHGIILDVKPTIIGISPPFKVTLKAHKPIPGTFFVNRFNKPEPVEILPGCMNGLPLGSTGSGSNNSHFKCASFEAQPIGFFGNAPLANLLFFPPGARHVHLQSIDGGGFTSLVARPFNPANGKPVQFTFSHPDDILWLRFECEGHWTARKYHDVAFLRADDEIKTMARLSWDPRKVSPTLNQGPCVLAGCQGNIWEAVVWSGPPPAILQQSPKWYNPSCGPFPPGARGSFDGNNMRWIPDDFRERSRWFDYTGGKLTRCMYPDAINDYETGANVRHVFDYLIGTDRLVVFEDTIPQLDARFPSPVFQKDDVIEARIIAQCYHSVGAECGGGKNSGEWPGYNHDPFMIAAPGHPWRSSGGLTTCHFDNLQYGRTRYMPGQVPGWPRPVPAAPKA